MSSSTDSAPSPQGLPNSGGPVRKDFDTLRTLSVLHVILAAVFALGIVVLALHYAFTLHYFYNDPTLKAERAGASLDPEFKSSLLQLYVYLALTCIAMCVTNFIASKHLYQGSKYNFLKITSFLNLLLFPMGTVVGLWTLRVLGRKAVKAYFLK